MSIAYIFIPFAYNGPCVTESGPKVMQFEINKKYGNKDMFSFELQWYETPADYMSRVYENILCLAKKYEKLIIFGGNHLSLLPIYQAAEKFHYNSVTFDAHRDYIRSKGMITHASFLRYVESHSSKKYILGFRDYIREEDKYDFFDDEISAKQLKENKMKLNIENNIDFIDIDVDFFDENIFPYTYCKKENGFSMDEFDVIISQLNLNNLKFISFSEYIQIIDENKKGIEFIFEVIKKILTKQRNYVNI